MEKETAETTMGSFLSWMFGPPADLGSTESSPQIVKGPGIDPTGATPSSDGLNAFFKENKRGDFYIPSGFYWLDAPVKLYEAATYTGGGSTPYQPTGHTPGVTRPSGTLFFAKESTEYPFRLDAEGHRTMFVSETWTQNEYRWMHNFGFTNIGLDGDRVADYGMKIYQMGEVGYISNCAITAFRQAGVLATGSHAPFTMRNCTVNGPLAKEVEPNTSPKTWVNDYPYTGLHFAKHPSFKGSGGAMRINGLSGDGNNGGILRVSGSHQVTLFGPKFENNSFHTIRFDAEGKGGNVGKGGGAASLTIVGGYSQDSTSHYKPSEEMIRIEEGVTPMITLQGFVYTHGDKIDKALYGYVPVLIRNIKTGEVIANLNSAKSIRTNMLTYGPGVSQFHSSLQLGVGSKVCGTLTNGAISSMLELNSDQVVALRAANSVGTGLKDSKGKLKLKINNTGVGFNGVKPVKRPTINGVVGSPEVQRQILSCLSDLGLAIDQTTEQ